jgi:hypothetical protein
MVTNAGQCHYAAVDRRNGVSATFKTTMRRTPLTSRNMKAFRSLPWSSTVLAGLLVLGSGLTATAQSVNAGSSNGLEGTWRVQLTVQDCQTGQVLRTFPALFAFAKGGTLTYATAGQLPSATTTGLGVWKHTEGHSYSAVSEVFIFSPAGVWIQTHRLTRAIDVSNDGDEFTDTVALQIFDTSGNQIVAGCGTSVGSRMK